MVYVDMELTYIINLKKLQKDMFDNKVAMGFNMADVNLDFDIFKTICTHADS